MDGRAHCQKQLKFMDRLSEVSFRTQAPYFEDSFDIKENSKSNFNIVILVRNQLPRNILMCFRIKVHSGRHNCIC